MTIELETAGEKPQISEEVTKPEADGKFDGMEKREALKEAIAIHKEGKEPSEPAPEKQTAAPTNTEVKAAVDSDIEPPPGFNKDGIKAWKEKDIAGIQKEFKRLREGGIQEISRATVAERNAKEEARLAKEEGKTWRDLGQQLAPYIESQGLLGVTPQQAMMNAISLIGEFQKAGKADKAVIKAELKKIGIDMDEAPGASKANNLNDPEEKALRNDLSALKKWKEQIEFRETVQTFDTAFKSLTSQKTRTGDPVFPDLLDNGESGMQFAKELGSLTKDERFTAGVLRRFPDADFTIIVREAYKFLGGRVSGEAVTASTKSNQQHIEKSRRAAASTPGRVVSHTDTSNLKGKLGKRAALAQGIADVRERYN